MRIHASAIKYNKCGILIRGESGAGKSTLASLLMNNAKERGLKTILISDDIVEINRRKDKIIASAPENIFGLMEIRGFGVIKIEAIQSAPIECVLDIVEAAKLKRMPEDTELYTDLFDIKIRRQPVPNDCFHRMLLLSHVAINGIPRV